MKSTVEQLTPTRVRINVEVPFTELQPDYDRTFRELAKQVRIPGFRPGKAPAPLIEARFGKEAVLDQVINNAVPARYGQAVTESQLRPLGQPEIEVTQREFGKELTFTAEVDVRPSIEMPNLEGLTVTVDPIEVSDEEVDAELESLRARFGTLKGVERAAADGDFVSIDLSAAVDGRDVPEAKTEGMSHQVGSGRLLDGLDDAISGLAAGQSKTFTTELVAGPHAGKSAEVTVTVGSVKERELPDADDDFAQLASEFDTIGELREDLVERVRTTRRLQQAEAARQATLDALIEQVEVPLPEALVQAHVDRVLHNEVHGLDHDEARFAEVLAERGSSRAEFDAETRADAERTVKSQLVLDEIADARDIQVSQNDATQHLILMSRQTGVPPEQLMAYLQENNQLPAVFSDIRRGKALASVVRSVTVTDSSGAEVDVTEFFISPEEAEQGEKGEQGDKSDESDKAAKPAKKAPKKSAAQKAPKAEGTDKPAKAPAAKPAKRPAEKAAAKPAKKAAADDADAAAE